MQFIWTRIFFVYGAGQRETSLIPRLISCAKGGKTPVIKDPDTKLDFIYVGDVADAIVGLIKSGQADGTYNIGSGKLTKVRDVVQIVGRLVKKEAKFKKLLPNKTKGTKSYHSGYYADVSKIKNEIQWKPEANTLMGIQKTIELTS